MQPTEEQTRIIEMARSGGSMKINAFAGTGKTTTLALLADAHPADQILYLAFNRDIANDASGRMGWKVESRTIHSMAYAAMRPDRSRLQMKMSGRWVADKLAMKEMYVGGRRIAPSVLGALALQTATRYCNSADATLSDLHVPMLEDIYADIPDSVAEDHAQHDLMRAMVLEAAKKLWAAQQKTNGDTPITHDTYLKQWALTEPRITADLIMFDEAQDANPVMLDVLTRQEAPIVWAGDKHQQIYAWRGAVDAISQVKSDNEGHLTQSFRFGEKIADVANAVLKHLGEEKPLLGIGGGGVDESRAILTRTNAQAIASFMRLKGEANLSGARDLDNTLDQLQSLKKGKPQGAFALFSNYEELIEYSEGPSGQQVKTILQAVENYGLSEIRSKIKQASSGGRYKTTVSTCHKAKGREWGHVRITPDWERNEDGRAVLTDEEARLMYVAVTRAKNMLDTSEIRPWLDLL